MQSYKLWKKKQSNKRKFTWIKIFSQALKTFEV